jgi:hypothetical protein
MTFMYLFLRFIGVIVYSARWNYFWQFNKTLALIFSYVYSCINPFALYFLSSTFRHFYKRYLFFWTNTSCCCSKRRLVNDKQRRRTGETGTASDGAPRSSTNNITAIYYDLNRMKTSNSQQQQPSPLRMHRYVNSDRISTESATQVNGNVGHSPITSMS